MNILKSSKNSFYLSEYSDHETANTNSVCALQRAENLFSLGVKTVIELCVGPSLQILEKCYNQFGIKVTGNDIDMRWKKFYPNGNWIIGNCMEVERSMYDSIVFAPPLSLGCSGRREDSLKVSEVIPAYETAIDLLMRNPCAVTVFVLPARSMSSKMDRKDTFKLLNQLNNINRKFELIPLKNKVIKYWDLYIYD